jgi:hypothetical protein
MNAVLAEFEMESTETEVKSEISLKKLQQIAGSMSMFGRLETEVKFIDANWKFISGSTAKIIAVLGNSVSTNMVNMDKQNFYSIYRYFCGNDEEHIKIKNQLAMNANHTVLLKKILAAGINRWEELELGYNSEVVPPVNLLPSNINQPRKTKATTKKLEPTAVAISSMETILTNVDEELTNLNGERDQAKRRMAEIQARMEALDTQRKAIAAGLEAVRRVANPVS